MFPSKKILFFLLFPKYHTSNKKCRRLLFFLFVFFHHIKDSDERSTSFFWIDSFLVPIFSGVNSGVIIIIFCSSSATSREFPSAYNIIRIAQSDFNVRLN
jgi:hypothetical protein